VYVHAAPTRLEPHGHLPSPTVRPRVVAIEVIVAVLALAALGFDHWQLAPTHGPVALFSRTTATRVTITVERGDVRVSHNVCGIDHTGDPCVERVPGIAIRFGLPDGRSGGGTTLPDRSFGNPLGARAETRVLVTAGLGLPPGATDESFIVVSAGPDVTRVRATLADGSFDEMQPVQGVAVLATAAGWDTRSHVTAYDAADNATLVVG
jgi:hypothetical protein